MSGASEQANGRRVAQYLRLYSCLLQTTVQHPRRDHHRDNRNYISRRPSQRQSGRGIFQRRSERPSGGQSEPQTQELSPRQFQRHLEYNRVSNSDHRTVHKSKSHRFLLNRLN